MLVLVLVIQLVTQAARFLSSRSGCNSIVMIGYSDGDGPRLGLIR